MADVEERWRARFGDAAVGSLRDALRPSAGQMPWAPPEVHDSDGFYTHVVDGPGAGDDVSFSGLMGQALTALTLEHERGSRASLPLAADVLRLIDDEVVPIRDLPRLAGVSTEAIAMGTGFLGRAKLAELRPGSSGRQGRLITLTPEGHAALEDYRARAARRDDQQLRLSLEAIVSQREALAEGLNPHEGGWRAQKPYLARRSACSPIRRGAAVAPDGAAPRGLARRLIGLASRRSAHKPLWMYGAQRAACTAPRPRERQSPPAGACPRY